MLRNVRIDFHHMDKTVIKKIIVSISPKLEYAEIVWVVPAQLETDHEVRKNIATSH